MLYFEKGCSKEASSITIMERFWCGKIIIEYLCRTPKEVKIGTDSATEPYDWLSVLNTLHVQGYISLSVQGHISTCPHHRA
jgi:hypothetical protein